MRVLLSLFRRAPPHLRGRVPVECGVGSVGAHFTVGVSGPAWVHPPDAVGRAFLATMPPMGVKSITAIEGGIAVRYENNEDGRRAQAKARATWAPPDDALTSAKRKAYTAADAGRSSAQVTPEEYAAVLRDTASHRWHAHVGTGDVHLYGVRLEVRPAPAENARRYTQEESTW